MESTICLTTIVHQDYLKLLVCFPFGCFSLYLDAKFLLTCSSLHKDAFLFCGSDICQPFSPWPGCSRAALV